jgi:hypothetical protein
MREGSPPIATACSGDGFSQRHARAAALAVRKMKCAEFVVRKPGIVEHRKGHRGYGDPFTPTGSSQARTVGVRYQFCAVLASAGKGEPKSC